MNLRKGQRKVGSRVREEVKVRAMRKAAGQERIPALGQDEGRACATRASSASPRSVECRAKTLT